MKETGKLIVIIAAAILSMPVSAQKNDCIYKQEFSSKPGTYLNVNSRYGDITIVTGNVDSVTVCSTITINHSDPAISRKSIDLIKVNMKKNADTISFETIYDKKFFTPAFSNGRKSFTVDYLIRVPRYINSVLKNEFGNITVDELEGFINVKLSHGTFYAKKLTRDNRKPVNQVNVVQGSVEIREAAWLSLKLNHCSRVSIDKADALLISSEFSKISAGVISSLVSDSKSDSYSIGVIRNLVSDSFYSTYDIGSLSGQLKSGLFSGSLSIAGINREFTLIDIEANRAPLKLVTGNDISFIADITSAKNLITFNLENFPGIIASTENDAKRFTGIYGKDPQTKSKIKIEASSGKLTILK